MGPINYEVIFATERFSKEKTNIKIENAFSSDKARVIFSSSFRRLQQKAQVFSLEKNPAVRSRLTHTLEVANTGSIIAKKVAQKLIARNELRKEFEVPFIDITETCCLLHDIGNPPFGHFGEAAIQRWFSKNWEEAFKASSNNPEIPKTLSEILINDFLFFDGNPQGLRMALHLQDFPDLYKGIGLNLTYSQILSFVKYNANPNDAKEGNSKKPGYFYSEAEKIETIKTYLNWPIRFPITYLMEAADDISYCMSDIEDGIEKDIIDSRHFFEKLFSLWKIDNLKSFGFDIETKDLSTRYHFFRFKVHLTRALIERASDIYINNQDKIAKGTIGVVGK
jgi:dGTPase